MKRGAALLLLALGVVACGDELPTVVATPIPGVGVTGAATGHFNLTPPGTCHVKGHTIDITINADDSTKLKPLHVIIRDYQGTATYQTFTGAVGTTGTTVQLTDAAGHTWVADEGQVIVNTTAFTRVAGSISVSMRPDGATGGVILDGQWGCTLRAATPNSTTK